VPTIHVSPYVHTSHVRELVSGYPCVAVELDPFERGRIATYYGVVSSFDASRYGKLLPPWVRIGRRWRRLPPQLFRLLVIRHMAETLELLAIDDELLEAAHELGRRVYFLEDVDEQVVALTMVDTKLVIDALEELRVEGPRLFATIIDAYYSGDFCRFVEVLRSSVNGRLMLRFAELRDAWLSRRVAEMLNRGCLVAVGAAHIWLLDSLGVLKDLCNKL